MSRPEKEYALTWRHIATIYSVGLVFGFTFIPTARRLAVGVVLAALTFYLSLERRDDRP